MSELTINTSQNVNINFTAASLGERLLAYLIDFGAKAAYCIVIYLIFFYWLGIYRNFNQLDRWSVIAICLVFFLPVMFYSLLLENIFEGQSFGKRIIRIKVVKIDGYQAGFGDYLIRWFFRIIDFSLLNGVVAVVAILSSKKSQRLGDMTAGTAVITLRNNVTINSTILEEIGQEYVPVYPLVIRLSDNDVRIIKETFSAARSKADPDTINKLKAKIESVTGIKNVSDSNAAFIETIIKDYNFYTQHM